MRPHLLLPALLLACSTERAAEKPASEATPEDPAELPVGDPADLAMPAGRSVLGTHLATGDRCAECHSNTSGADAMRDADGAPIAPYDLQHGTMMANAGRDPLFWAVFSAEVARAPDLEGEIGDTCFRCHAPMAHADAASAGDETPTAAEIRAGDDDRAMLGLDGVTCVACHKATADDLGERATFTGRYTLDTSGRVFGPHDDLFTHPMEMHTGWVPTAADHVTESAACASCHTLLTHTVADGALTGDTFLEQSPYLEWRNSAYSTEGGGTTPASCQDCHLPTVDAAGRVIETAIARRPNGTDFPPISDRTPYGRHVQVGGNALMLSILRDNADVLNPAADAATLDAVIGATRDFLGTAATVALGDPVRQGGGVAFDVTVTNRTGHKLPTGYPARRLWLELSIEDADSETVFAMGQVDGEGRIVGPDGAPLAWERASGPVAPHRDRVTATDEVPVWEMQMADAAGTPVFRLLAAAEVARDDRLLPAGWDPARTDTDVGDIGPVGVDGDADFGAGGDTVHVALAELPGTAPHTVTATLRYQPVSPRWVAELATVDTPEVAAFLAMWVAADRAPETLATATATVP